MRSVLFLALVSINVLFGASATAAQQSESVQAIMAKVAQNQDQAQAIRSALERSSDTLLTFALRAVERAVSDQSRTNRETINQLWDILDDPHLNKALGLPQNSRMTSRRSRF